MNDKRFLFQSDLETIVSDVYNVMLKYDIPVSLSDVRDMIESLPDASSQEDKLYDIAEAVAETILCDVKCLCPTLKEAGICCQCEVFSALRDYYVQELKETINK